jgi:hypothetical protein
MSSIKFFAQFKFGNMCNTNSFDSLLMFELDQTIGTRRGGIEQLHIILVVV